MAWRVDSYHISLGVVGDSSIHLMVEDGKYLKWAVLVDGGKRLGAEAVVRTIASIEGNTKYDWSRFPAGGNKLKFDVVIISHWDNDHYSGVLYAINGDLEQQLTDHPTEPKPRVSFLRYDAAGAPTTILYCPEVNYKTARNPKFSAKPTSPAVETVGFVTKEKGAVQDVVRVQIEPESTSSATLLGVELFTGKGLVSPTDVKDLDSPLKLLNYHRDKYSWGPADAARPHIFITAASTRTFTGPGLTGTGLTGTRFTAETLMLPSFLVGGNPVGVVDENETSSWPTPTNKSSIACMIVWDIDKDTAPRLSQYFGGDLPWLVEDKLVRWTGAKGDRTKPGSWVPVLKLSHHGAKSSTPIQMLKDFNPRHVIASVADKNGHPSWELVLYLLGWLWGGSAEDASIQPFLSTQYPYYLAREDAPGGTGTVWVPLPNGPSNQMAMGILTEGGTVAKNYREALTSAYEAASASIASSSSGMKLEDPVEAWKKTGKPASEAREWVRDYILSHWTYVSPVKSTNHAAVSGRAGGSSTTITDADKLEFFLVEGYNDDDLDGTAYVKYKGSSEPEKLWPTKVAPVTGALPIPAAAAIGSASRKRVSPMPSGFDGTDKRHKGDTSLGVVVKPDSFPAYNSTNPNENGADEEMDVDPDPGIDDFDDYERRKREIATRDDELPPALPLPLPPPGFQPGPPGEDDNLQAPFFYICASTVTLGTGSGPDTTKQLAPDHPQNDFLSVLHTEGLVLEDKPEDADTPVQLHLQDEVQAWLSLALNKSQVQPAPLLVSVKTDTETGDMSEFAVTLPFALESAPATILTFSSTATKRVLDAGDNWGLGEGGIVPPVSVLILGLVDDGSHEATLGDIFRPAVERSSGGQQQDALTLLLTVLGKAAKFDLDASAGSRSCLWFAPAAGYHTVLRMQYAMQAGPLQSLNTWIASTLGLKDFALESVKVITKLGSRWVATSADTGAVNDWEFALTATCTLGAKKSLRPSVTLDVRETSVAITLQLDKQDDTQSVLGELIDWVASQFGVSPDFPDLINGAGGTSNFDLPVFRRLTMILGLDVATGKPNDDIDLKIDAELGLHFGVPDPGAGGLRQQVLFLFSYTWNKAQGRHVFRGTLWGPRPPPGAFDNRLLSDYEPYQELEPITLDKGSTWSGTLDLANLIPAAPGGGGGGPSDKVSKIPDGVPRLVTKAVLQIDNNSISFEGAIGCKEPTPGNIPSLYLYRIDLAAKYTWSPKPTNFHLEFDIGASMTPPERLMLPVELRGSLTYDTAAGWDISAEMESVGAKGAHFLDFFDTKPGGGGSSSPPSKLASAATALVQHIQLNHLGLRYKYQNPGGDEKNLAKEFHFDGSLSIGLLDLDLTFDYTGPGIWAFKAQAVAGKQCSIQELLDSIIGDATIQLPECVGQIDVTPPASGGGGGGGGGGDGGGDGIYAAGPDDGIFLSVQKLKSNSTLEAAEAGETKTEDLAGDDDRDLLFTVTVALQGISFTFLQFRNSSWDVTKKPSKRFLKLAASKLPDVSAIPVIDKIAQPFDELYFMYVQDGVNKQGFTKAEVEAVNQSFGREVMFFKPRKAVDEIKPADVVVEAGCHFTLVIKDGDSGQSKPVLDYVFARPKADDNVPPPAVALRNHVMLEMMYGKEVVVTRERLDVLRAMELRQQDPTLDVERYLSKRKEAAAAADDSGDTEGDGSTSKEAVKKSVGTLSIANLGLRFLNGKLAVCLDASVTLGPVGIALQGFSIDVDLKSVKLQGGGPGGVFPSASIGVSLQGLAVSLEKPPLTVVGALFHKDDFWVGGVGVGWVPWFFAAAGGYGVLQDPPGSGNEFKSAFVIVQLDGPLLTLEFATLSGLRGGYGHNTAMTLPRAEEVPTFPLMNLKGGGGGGGGGDSTVDIFMSLIDSKWFNPKDGEFWVAAGLTVTAFEMLQIQAVIAVGWGPSGVQLSLFAVALADIPSTQSKFKIAHVEIGIIATVDFTQGVAKIEAQMAPSSFILDPSCHLTGGMALYYWFKDGPSQRSGDWVFTLGGYNPAYKPPSQYPNPPRLGISWSLGPLSITGSAYFAITPNVAMAGVELHAALNVGVLHAFLDAWADFLINYRPFLFSASGGVAVGVRFTLDLWLVTIHINVQIGATLFLQGPPFQGVCHVDFWVFGFDIAFGSSDRVESPARVSLLEFYRLVLQKGSPTAGATAPVPHLFQCLGGILPPPSSSSPPPSVSSAPASAPPTWQVAAGTFSFSVTSVFAVSDVTIAYSEDDEPPEVDETLKAPSDETASILSRPMYLSDASMALQSELRITFIPPPIDLAAQEEEAEAEDEDDGHPDWGLTPIISSVPKALWDKYDSSSDPTNGSRSLLGNPDNGTVRLMMGIQLTAPPPHFSDDRIKPFDAVLSQIAEVIDPVPFPDTAAVQDPAWSPALVPEETPEDDPRPWEIVQELWKTPRRGSGAAAVAVRKWADAMRWVDEDGGVGGSIRGDVPERLVDGLQTLYVAAPMVAVGAA